VRQARPACERARVCLYRPDARTAKVLVQHALSRFEDAYSVSRFATKQVGARVARGRGWAAGRRVFEPSSRYVCGEENMKVV